MPNTDRHTISYNGGVKIGVVGVGAVNNLLAEISRELMSFRLRILAIHSDEPAMIDAPCASLLIHKEDLKERGATDIAAALGQLDIIFVIAVGNGNCTGAAPIVAEIARSSGALCIAIAIPHFVMEGRRLMSTTPQCIDELLERADAVFTNQRQLDPGEGLYEAFTGAHRRLISLIRDLVLLHRRPGMISIDLSDVLAMFDGRCEMGMGIARGSERALKAVSAAVVDNGLKDVLPTARNVLVILRSYPDLLVGEFGAVAEYLQAQSSPETTLVVGTAIDSTLTDELAATVIATGIPDAASRFGGRQLDALLPVQSPRGAQALNNFSHKPIHLFASEHLSPRQVAEVVGHLSALYRSVGGDELIVTDITHITPNTDAGMSSGSKLLRRTG